MLIRNKSNTGAKLNCLSVWRNTSGMSAVSFAIALPALLGAVGVATDYGFLEMKRTRLQSVADQSAITAVKELALANSTDASITAVADSYARGMVDLSNSTLTVDVDVDDKAGSVGVELREEWTPFFAHFIKSDVTPVVVSAKAQLAGKANLCVLTLDPTGTKALHMDKSARLEANGCAVYSNSSHTQAIRLDQNSEMSASAICAVGAVKAKTSAVKPAPTTDCSVIEDPLAQRQPAVITGCAPQDKEYKTGKHTLSPGRYCGGLKISGDAEITFTEGDYAIADGAFSVSGNAVVTSLNASFYLEGKKATLDFTGNSTLKMSGAKDGPMAGMLFFEDRSVATGRIHRINSAFANELTGTIYLSRGKLRVDPNASVAKDSAFTAIVAYQLEIDEGPTLVLNSNYDDTNVPVPDGIRIDTQVVLAR